MSSRLTATRGAAVVGCAVGAFTSGFVDWFTGFVSNATRLMSIRWIGETLSDVTLPPHDPHPSVIDGFRSVESPMAPCVVGELMTIREAGICLPYSTAAS